MRTFLSSLIPLALLFTVDVNVESQTVGFSVANAADFTGRIKRVRIRRRRVGTSFQVVTEVPPGTSSEASTMQVFLEPMEGAPPAELESDLAELARDTARFSFEVPESVAVADLKVVVTAGDASIELPVQEVLAEADEGEFGPAFPAEVLDGKIRARRVIGADGASTVDIRVISSRGTSLQALQPVVLETFEGVRRVPLVLSAVDSSTLRAFEVGLAENPDDPIAGAYSVQATWRDAGGEVVDELQYVMDEGVEPQGTRVERSVLRASERGTVLVTQVSTPDASPVLLEASVTDMDGNSVIALADEAPRWTERQFMTTGLQFDDDPTGSTYLVLVDRLDPEGNPVGQQTEVEVVAERPDASGEIDASLFMDGQAQMALIPGAEEGTWQIFMRTLADDSSAQTALIFEEPFEGPAPLETEVYSELTRVWRQFRQRDNTPSEGVDLQKVSVTASGEGAGTAAASGLEVDGPVVATGRSVEDIDGFLASVSGTSRPSTIRVRTARRMRR